MKKLFVLFAAVTLFVGVQACKQKTEEATEEVATEEVTEEVAPVVDSAAVAAPADSAAAEPAN
ncbi:MAG: hypothetical protein IPM95_07710 [Sphingobacteriales bacterium]|jgi:hypothetical protein|nr:hypothetical protein [Sphingobacteriales bacterium]